MTKIFKQSRRVVSLALVLSCTLLCGCEKFLDEKPDSRLATVSSAKDIQALLDNYLRVNENDQAVTQICSDDSYLPEAVFNARREVERNIYVWAPANVFEPGGNAWSDTYATIYIANLAIESAEALYEKSQEKNILDAIKGQGFFHRGREFLQAVSVWTPDYEESSANRTLGIPLPLSSDFNKPTTRATLEESYSQILSDLKASVPLLPSSTTTPFRPSKSAAYGMLARAYLYKDNFIEAGKYADSCLQGNNSLLDYNTLNTTSNFPIPRLNKEIIFESRLIPAGQIVSSRAYVDPGLYALYQDNDLRKSLLFRMGAADWIFKGSYEGQDAFFNGLAVDEILLIRAECAARNGATSSALSDLNLLRKTRIRSAAFTPVQAASLNEVLKLIKTERRIEIPFRGLRWMDIKRFNSEGDNIVLVRKVGQTVYRLEPNSLLYAIALPEDLVQLAEIPQNPR